MAGNVAEDRFLYANEPLVHANLATFLDYTPLRSLRDLNCGLAGETTFTNNHLHELEHPIYTWLIQKPFK